MINMLKINNLLQLERAAGERYAALSVLEWAAYITAHPRTQMEVSTKPIHPADVAGAPWKYRLSALKYAHKHPEATPEQKKTIGSFIGYYHGHAHVPGRKRLDANGEEHANIGKIKKGALHEQEGIPQDEKIGEKRLEDIKEHGTPLAKKRANFALNMHHHK